MKCVCEFNTKTSSKYVSNTKNIIDHCVFV
jgi:hypothetical protein